MSLTTKRETDYSDELVALRKKYAEVKDLQERLFRLQTENIELKLKISFYEKALEVME